MLIVISPAKSLDFETKPTTSEYTIPEFLTESEKLVAKLRKMSAKKLSELMSISADLGNLNFERYQTWHLPFTPENAKQAVLTFNGDFRRKTETGAAKIADFVRIVRRFKTARFDATLPPGNGNKVRRGAG